MVFLLQEENQIVTKGKYVSFTNKYYILKDYRTVWNASLNSCFNKRNPRITKDRLVTLTWRPFGGGSCRTRSFIRETFAISAATASWCVAFLMSFPLTYKKAWFWITQKNPLFCWNKVTLQRPIFPDLAKNRRPIFECYLTIEFARNILEISSFIPIWENKLQGNSCFSIKLDWRNICC